MRTLHIPKVISILIVTGCAATATVAPQPSLPTTPSAFSDHYELAPPPTLNADVDVFARDWARRWWTAPDTLRRIAAVRALSTPSLNATLASTRSVDNAPERCIALTNVQTFIGHGLSIEVTITATCHTAQRVEARVIVVRATTGNGRVLVDDVR